MVTWTDVDTPLMGCPRPSHQDIITFVIRNHTALRQLLGCGESDSRMGCQQIPKRDSEIDGIWVSRTRP